MIFHSKIKEDNVEDNSRKNRWKKRNREKHAAHASVYRALRKEEIVKTPCFCGNVNVQAHHEDYSKPLQVEFLCSKHHKKRHIEKLKVESNQ